MPASPASKEALAALEDAFERADMSALRARLAVLERDHPQDVVVRVARARLVAAEEGVPAALPALEKVCAAHPADLYPRAYLGTLLVAQRKYDQGRAILEKVLADGVDIPAAHHALGVALGAAGEHEAALKELETAAQRMPSSGPTYFFMGASAAELGRWDQASAAFTRSCELNPRNPLAFEALARVEVERGHADAARGVLEEGLRHNPDFPALLRLRVQLLADLRDTDGALAALEAFPAAVLSAEDLVHKAMLEMASNRWVKALDDAQAAVALEPASGRAHYTLGLALEGQEPMERSAVLAAYRAALEHGDPLGEAGTRLGFLLLEDSADGPPDVAEAIRVLEAARPVSGEAPGTLLNLALAYAKAERKAEARACCEQVLKDADATPGLQDQARRLVALL